MSSNIDERLKAAGVVIPDVAAPAGNYVGFLQVGDMVHVSGQLPLNNGDLTTGRLGEDLTIQEGMVAARACAINLLAQVRAACDGDLGRLQQVVKLTGFVNSAPGFTDQPKVINGASDFLVEILGDIGRHTRAAVGVAALPLGVAVEIDGLFQIK